MGITKFKLLEDLFWQNRIKWHFLIFLDVILDF